MKFHASSLFDKFDLAYLAPGADRETAWLRESNFYWRRLKSILFERRNLVDSSVTHYTSPDKELESLGDVGTPLISACTRFRS